MPSRIFLDNFMSDHGVTEAFTTDRHFEQAGFHCLLPVAAVA